VRGRLIVPSAGPYRTILHPDANDPLYYNAGHPGVEKPHYHVVLWHVAKDQAKLQ
jgi:hypothetical protein